MAPTLESLGIDKLSAGERMSLMHDLWDSLSSEEQSSTITAAQKAEVDRRLAAHEANPSAAIPWEQIEAETLARWRK